MLMTGDLEFFIIFFMFFVLPVYSLIGLLALISYICDKMDKKRDCNDNRWCKNDRDSKRRSD